MRITLYVLAALAEAERALIVERTRAGLAAAQAAGRRGGRPAVVTADRLTVARQLVDLAAPSRPRPASSASSASPAQPSVGTWPRDPDDRPTGDRAP